MAGMMIEVDLVSVDSLDDAAAMWAQEETIASARRAIEDPATRTEELYAAARALAPYEQVQSVRSAMCKAWLRIRATEAVAADALCLLNPPAMFH